MGTFYHYFQELIIMYHALKILLITFFSMTISQASDSFDESVLKERVNSRWQSLITHQFDKTYSYESPNYRQVFSKELYINKFSPIARWSLTKITNITYHSRTKVATVSIEIATQSIMGSTSATVGLKEAVNTMIQEKWLFIDKQWWYISR